MFRRCGVKDLGVECVVVLFLVCSLEGGVGGGWVVVDLECWVYSGLVFF